MTFRGTATAVLLAAGAGERAGGDLPKQFLQLGDRPMMSHSLAALAGADEVASIVVVLPSERPSFIEDELNHEKITSIAEGGPTRQASLAEGLICIPDEASVVLVHDAARPLLTTGLTSRVLNGLSDHFDGAISAIRMEDALKEVTGVGEVVRGLPRRGLWRAQTPQAFERSALEDSLSRADAEGRVCEDCSEMLVRSGYRIRAVPGEVSNLKVTTMADLKLAETLLGARYRSEGHSR